MRRDGDEYDRAQLERTAPESHLLFARFLLFFAEKSFFEVECHVPPTDSSPKLACRTSAVNGISSQRIVSITCLEQKGPNPPF